MQELRKAGKKMNEQTQGIIEVTDIDKFLAKLNMLKVDKMFKYKDSICIANNKQVFLYKCLAETGVYEIPSFVTDLYNRFSTIPLSICYKYTKGIRNNYIFSQAKNLKVLNSSKIKSMSGLFECCKLLEELDRSEFDASMVTSMRNAFGLCKKLKKLNLNNLDTSNVVSTRSMFSHCRQLQSVDLSSSDLSNVRHMMQMFMECRELSSVDFGNIDMGKVDDFEMFRNCEKLKYFRTKGIIKEICE